MFQLARHDIPKRFWKLGLVLELDIVLFNQHLDFFSLFSLVLQSHFIFLVDRQFLFFLYLFEVHRVEVILMFGIVELVHEIEVLGVNIFIGEFLLDCLDALVNPLLCLLINLVVNSDELPLVLLNLLLRHVLPACSSLAPELVLDILNERQLLLLLDLHDVLDVLPFFLCYFQILYWQNYRAKLDSGQYLLAKLRVIHMRHLL